MALAPEVHPEAEADVALVVGTELFGAVAAEDGLDGAVETLFFEVDPPAASVRFHVPLGVEL